MWTTDTGLTYPAYLPNEALASNDAINVEPGLDVYPATPTPAPPAAKPDVGPNFSPAGPNMSPAPVMSEAPNMTPSVLEAPKPEVAKPKLTVDEALERAYKAEGGGVNPKTGAYGPIQLMPGRLEEVATKLGISTDDIKKMSPEEYKKEVVPAYFAAIGHPLDKIAPEDVYMGIAAPGFVGASGTTPIVDKQFGAWKKGSAPWEQNKNTWAKIAESHGRDFIQASDLREYGGIEGDAVPGQKLSPEDQSSVELANRLSSPTVTGGVKSMTTALGTPVTEEDKAYFAQREADIKASGALQKGAVSNVMAEAKEAQDARKEMLAQQDAERKQRETDAKSLYDRRQADVQSAVKDVADNKAPAPFGGNVFAGILATIGQALGAYGAAINKTRNFAADLVNSALDRDMKKWEQDQITKRFKVSSLEKLSDDARLTLKEASNDREQTQRLLYDNELKRLSTQQWSTEQNQTIQRLQDNNQQHSDELRMEAERQSRARVSITQQGGSVIPATTEDINKRAKAELESGKTPEEVAKAKALIGAESKIPVSDKERDEYTKDADNRAGRPTLDSAERTIIAMAPALGMAYDPKTGQLTDSDGKDHMPRAPGGSPIQSPFWAAAALQGDEDSKKAMLGVANAAALSAKAINGRAASDKEFDRAFERIGGFSKETQLKGLNAQLEEIRQKRNDLNTAFPGAASDYETRNSAGQKALPVSFTPKLTVPNTQPELENPADALRP